MALFKITAALSLAFLIYPFSLVADPIQQIDYGSISVGATITFDDQPGGRAPGANFDSTLKFGELLIGGGGVEIGERFDGQSLSFSGNSDILSSTAADGLSVVAGAKGQNLNIFAQGGNNALTGLGRLGFPEFDAIGEGSVAIRFDTDQSEFGFQSRGGNAGGAVFNFFRRDGSLIDTITPSNLSNDSFGIQREDGIRDIAGISIHNTDPAGIAFDNFVFNRQETALLFREKGNPGLGPFNDGFWGVLGDEIPGWDHVGLQVGDDDIYESHPGYASGTYTNSSGDEMVEISQQNGVQNEHTRGTFEHDALVGKPSPVTDFRAVPIAGDLALRMSELIESRDTASFQGVGISSPELRETTLSPEAQKGGNNSFTCVGLLEWAAEQAGHNGGQGFIPDILETVNGRKDFPLLSPQLLFYAVTSPNFVNDISNLVDGLSDAITGFFDPVDFLLTDIQGRRLGFVEGLGAFNEIPNAFYSGDGLFEQIMLHGIEKGEYTLELFGLGENATVALNGFNENFFFDDFLADGEKRTFTLFADGDLAPVPLPPAGLLMFVALLSLPLLSRGLGPSNKVEIG